MCPEESHLGLFSPTFSDMRDLDEAPALPNVCRLPYSVISQQSAFLHSKSAQAIRLCAVLVVSDLM